LPSLTAGRLRLASPAFQHIEDWRKAQRPPPQRSRLKVARGVIESPSNLRVKR
jgi:hypothetical protein